MTATEAKWSERVREWRASGKTAEEFASGFEFEASTLRYWASRLKAQVPTSESPPAIVRVRRTPRRAASVVGEGDTADSSVEVVIGGARVVVRRGFDAELLREVVAALGSAR